MRILEDVLIRSAKGPGGLRAAVAEMAQFTPGLGCAVQGSKSTFGLLLPRYPVRAIIQRRGLEIRRRKPLSAPFSTISASFAL